MGDKSKIQWTDATWNPVTGCDEISPGCAHCYAKTFAERFRGVPGHAYEQGFDLKLWPDRLDMPLSWKRPRRIFVNSMSDLFHMDVPDEFIGRVWSKMLEAHWHTFQVCTKRAERMHEIVTRLVEEGRRKGLREPRNIVGMVSAENQKCWDLRVPLLTSTPFDLTVVSVEPMLGPIVMWGSYRKPDGVIFGGESGPKARPCNVEWIRDGLRQCREAGVASFVKQIGANAKGSAGADYTTKDRKGGDPAEWPEALRVREWPA